jgi:hypothetical protein
MIEDPRLPDFIGQVTLRNLTVVDGTSADVMLRRSGSQGVVDVLDRRGPVKVITTA